MPSAREHLRKARENEQLSLQLQGTPFTDWCITTMFYSGLHWVDAWLADQPIPTRAESHRERNLAIQSDPHLRRQWRNYRELMFQSMEARYECAIFELADVRAAYAQTFMPLRRHIENSLPDSLRS